MEGGRLIKQQIASLSLFFSERIRRAEKRGELPAAAGTSQPSQKRPKKAAKQRPLIAPSYVSIFCILYNCFSAVVNTVDITFDTKIMQFHPLLVKSVSTIRLERPCIRSFIYRRPNPFPFHSLVTLKTKVTDIV